MTTFIIIFYVWIVFVGVRVLEGKLQGKKSFAARSPAKTFLARTITQATQAKINIVK